MIAVEMKLVFSRQGLGRSPRVIYLSISAASAAGVRPAEGVSTATYKRDRLKDSSQCQTNNS